MQQLRTCMMVSDVRAANCSSTCSHFTITCSHDSLYVMTITVSYFINTCSHHTVTCLHLTITCWLSHVCTWLPHVHTSQSHAHTSLSHALKCRQVCKATRFQDMTYFMVWHVSCWSNVQAHRVPDINLTTNFFNPTIEQQDSRTNIESAVCKDCLSL